MLAVVWSLVGLLAVALGLLATAFFNGLSRLETRIDALGSDLRSEIRGLGSDLRTEIRDEITGLRAEIRGEIRDVRDAVHRLDVRLTSAGG